jgi:hypothetical protein
VHFRNIKRECPKGRINEFKTTVKNKNIRGVYKSINKFKKDHQPQTNFVKYENGDLLAVF